MLRVKVCELVNPFSFLYRRTNREDFPFCYKGLRMGSSVGNDVVTDFKVVYGKNVFTEPFSVI